MAVDPEASTLTPPFLAGAWAAICAAGAAAVPVLAGIAVVFRAIARVRRDSSDQIEGVRKTASEQTDDVRKSAEAGDAALWKDRMNGDREANDVRVDAERHFATKADLAELRSALERRMAETEARMNATLHSGIQQIQLMIANRGPVTTRGAGE